MYRDYGSRTGSHNSKPNGFRRGLCLAQSANDLGVVFGFTARGIKSVTASGNDNLAITRLLVDDSTLADVPIAYDPELRKRWG